jgi:hypothetical protein
MDPANGDMAHAVLSTVWLSLGFITATKLAAISTKQPVFCMMRPQL